MYILDMLLLLVLLDLLEQGSEYLPGVLQLVSAHKIELTAVEHLQDESLVRVRQSNVLIIRVSTVSLSYSIPSNSASPQM